MVGTLGYDSFLFAYFQGGGEEPLRPLLLNKILSFKSLASSGPVLFAEPQR